MNKVGMAMAMVALSGAMFATAAQAAQQARAELVGADGEPKGSVALRQTPHGVLIQADLQGLPEGAHGFHIHQTGACKPGFKAAGGHYNPAGNGHGIDHDNGFHAGDLPNIHVTADGTARADYLWDKVSLDAGAPATLFDEDGSAFVVHENADSYGASAGAGSRIACGVIEAK